MKQVVRYETDRMGVYELGDVRENTLFFGSGPLRHSLMMHLEEHEFPLASQYRVETLQSETECQAQEKQLLRKYEARYGVPPLYNRTGNQHRDK